MGTGAWVSAQRLQTSEADAEQKRQEALKLQLAPLSASLTADRERLTQYVDPRTGNPIPQYQSDYEATVDRMASTIGQMRTLLGQKQPSANPNPVFGTGAHLLDRLHITRDLVHRMTKAQAEKAAAYQNANRTEAQEYGQAVALSPLQQKIAEARQAGATPDEIQELIREAVNPLAAKEKQDLKNFRNTQTGEVKLFDANKEIPPGWVLAPTGTASNQPEAKALESGGVPYGVQDTQTGKTYYASQMNDPNTPQSVKETWKTLQDAIKAKQEEADKKQREADERQLRGLAAIAARMGQSEAFQEQMANYRSQLGEYQKLDKQARDDEAQAQMYQQEASAPGNKSAFDTALVTDYTGILAKGGRKTQAEIAFAQKIGGLGLRADRMWKQAEDGELPDQMRQLYIQYMQARAKEERAEADAAKPDMPSVGPQGPKTQTLRQKKTAPDVIVVTAADMKGIQ